MEKTLKLIQTLIDYFCPFHQIGTRSIEEDTPEHKHEPMRMRNRWKLIKLQPFIFRWSMLAGAFGLSLYVVGNMPNSIFSLVFGLILWTCWVSSMAILGFILWLYSMRR